MSLTEDRALTFMESRSPFGQQKDLIQLQLTALLNQHFAVYSGREDAANSRATKSHTVESVAVNPDDKQQIIITLNDSTPVEEDSIIEIEYEYPGLSDANGRLITLDGRDVPTFQLNFGGDNGGGGVGGGSLIRNAIQKSQGLADQSGETPGAGAFCSAERRWLCYYMGT